MIYIYKTDHRYAVVGFVLCRRRFNGRYQTDKAMQPIGRVLKTLIAVYNGGFIFGRWCIFEVYDLHMPSTIYTFLTKGIRQSAQFHLAHSVIRCLLFHKPSLMTVAICCNSSSLVSVISLITVTFLLTVTVTLFL